jgi:hypothetical protein
MVDRSVMDAAGIIPEEDLSEEESAETITEKPISEDDERLSIFEDFLEGLDEDAKDEDDKDRPSEEE